MNAPTIKPADIRKVLTIRATPAQAFKVFTDGIDRWWPRTHTIGATPLKRAVIEPGVGGRWYGLSEAGVEDVWGEVLVWDPPARLVLAWRISGQWTCDPAVHTEVEARFTDNGDGTTLMQFEHRMLEGLGAGAEAARGQMDGGWGTILGLFKDAVEA